MPNYRLANDEIPVREMNCGPYHHCKTELSACQSALDFVASLLSLPASETTLEVSLSALNFVAAVLSLPAVAASLSNPMC